MTMIDGRKKEPPAGVMRTSYRISRNHKLMSWGRMTIEEVTDHNMCLGSLKVLDFLKIS